MMERLHGIPENYIVKSKRIFYYFSPVSTIAIGKEEIKYSKRYSYTLYIQKYVDTPSN
jgi:hypothetical protein